MNNLDLIVHSDSKVSIRDTGQDIDISDSKWNFIFHKMLKKAEVIYFKGYRSNYIDDEFETTISYLSATAITSTLTKEPFELFIKLKSFDFNYNRRLLAKLWNYFEHSSLYILGSLQDENEFTRMLKGVFFYDEIISSVNDIAILYNSSELDVLWVEGSLDFPTLET